MKRNTRRRLRSTTPLVAALKQHWGRAELVAIPIGHAGTTLARALNHLTAAFSKVRPRMEHTNGNKGISMPIMVSNARSHDYRMLKSLLDALVDLAHSRLSGIIRNRKRLVEAVRHCQGPQDATEHTRPQPRRTHKPPHSKGSHPRTYDWHCASPGERCHYMKWRCRRILAHLHPGPHLLRDPAPI
jgi:hypothetical protein